MVIELTSSLSNHSPNIINKIVNVTTTSSAGGLGISLYVNTNSSGIITHVSLLNVGNNLYAAGDTVTLPTSAIGGTVPAVITLTSVNRPKYYKPLNGDQVCDACDANGCINSTNNSPGVCKAGYTSTDSGVTCTPCGKGTYKGSSGNSACTPVPAGKVGRTADETTAITNEVAAAFLSPCSAGYFRAEGSVGTAADCVDVGAGKVGRTSNTATTGLADSVHQTAAAFEVGCYKGTYRGFANDYSDCIIVPAGSVGRTTVEEMAIENETGAAFATVCAVGYYRNNTMRDAYGDCMDIGPGKQGQLTDAGSSYAESGAIVQVDCIAGKFSLDGDGPCNLVSAGSVGRVADDADATANQVGALYASPCIANFFRAATGTADCGDISPGKQGQTSATVGDPYAATGATHEVDCVAGKFSLDGNGECGDISPGKQGQTSATIGDLYAATGASFEVDCAAGKYNVNGDGECASCTGFGGTGYTIVPGSLSCIPCDADAAGCTAASPGTCKAGYFSPGGNGAVCTICPLGTAKAAGNEEECPACLTGSFAKNSGQETCTDVSSGFYGVSEVSGAVYPPSGSGAKDQHACLVGKYSLYGDGECEDISPGYQGVNNAGVYVDTGAVNVSPCGIGYYSISGDGACQQVLAGSYAANSDDSEATSAAVKSTFCPVGTFSANGATACTPCGAGYATAVGNTAGSIPRTACVCAPGYGRSTDDNSSECIACVAGTWKALVSDDSCTPCVAGRFMNPASNTQITNTC